jgi:putative transposase
MNNDYYTTHYDEEELMLISLSTVECIDIFIRPVYKQIIVHSLNYFIHHKGLVIYGWYLSTNALHLLVKSRDGYRLHEVIQQYRGFTTDKIMEALDTEPVLRKHWLLDKIEKSKGLFSSEKKIVLWQEDMTAITVDSSNLSEIAECLYSIHETAVKDRVVNHAADYVYSSAGDYAGQQGLVEIFKKPLIAEQLATLQNMSGHYAVKYVKG